MVAEFKSTQQLEPPLVVIFLKMAKICHFALECTFQPFPQVFSTISMSVYVVLVNISKKYHPHSVFVRFSLKHNAQFRHILPEHITYTKHAIRLIFFVTDYKMSGN